MAIKGTNSKNGKAVTTEPRSLSIANRGIRTSEDLARVMAALIGDIASGRITPRQGNAVCNEVGKLLNATSTAISLEERLRRLMAL